MVFESSNRIIKFLNCADEDLFLPCQVIIEEQNEKIVILYHRFVSQWRSGSRIPAKSKMEFFMALFNDFQPTTNATKSSSSCSSLCGRGHRFASSLFRLRFHYWFFHVYELETTSRMN